MREMLDDARIVSAVGCGENFWKLGSDEVTCIKIYGEPGEYCMIPWCAIFFADNEDPALRIKPDFVRYL